MGELSLIVPSGIAGEYLFGAGAHGHPDDARAVWRRLRIHLRELRRDDFAFFNEGAPGDGEVGTPDGRRVGTGVLRVNKAHAIVRETADCRVSGFDFAGA